MTMNTTPAPGPAVAHESGFTLVELLVVMVIGLTMLLGVVTLLRQLHHQFRAQTVVARLNDDARFAFEIMADAIQGAGSTDPDNPQQVENPVLGDPNGDPNQPVDANQLTVTYYSLYGCYGGDTPGFHTVVFSHEGKPPSSEKTKLMRNCDGKQPLIGDDAVDDDGNAVDYVTTVEQLSFSYAMDRDGDQSVDCWWPEDQACSTDPADVIGVRVKLDLSAQNPTPDQPNKPQGQDVDDVQRHYEMTFAIDSKLGFFVPNKK